MKYFTPERLEYFKKAYRELKKYKKLTILSVVFSVAASIFEGFSIGTIIPFFQNIINPTTDNPLTIPFLGNIQKIFFQGRQGDIILKLMAFALLMIVFKSLFSYLKTLSISRVGTLIRRDLQNEMFEGACEADLKFINRVKAGNLVSSVSTFTKSIVSFYFTLLEMVSKISEIVVYALLLLSMSWKFTLAAVVLEAALIPPIKKIFSKIKKVSMYATEESAVLNHQMIEKLGNVKLIKIFTAEDYEKKNFRRVSTSLADLDYKNDSYEAVIGPISEISVMASMIVIFTVAIKAWGLNMAFYLPLLIAYFYIFLKIFNVFNSVLKSVAKIFQFMEPYKAYEKLLGEARQNKINNGKIKINAFENSIIFKDVSFAYEPDEKILDNINLTITRGKFTALVGPTGAGKSTIANMIAGLLLPTSGKLMIDGQDIKGLDLKYWRTHLGYISQDIIIFNDTIAANIAYGYFNARQEDIVAAAKIARIADFVDSLPQKYETILGEKGARLSGGQKQRIAIARAVIRDPKILILDEATSALDTETEKAIQESLDSILNNKTIIAIAHRLSTIKKADKIAVIHDGQIVEQGSHEELIKMSRFYKKYYEQQFEN